MMLNRVNCKAIIPIWIVGFLYILPLLITNSQYYDDIGRSVYGYFSWGIDGRPLSDLIFNFIDLGSPATDIAPLPQILSIFIMTTLCFFMHKYLNPEHKTGWLVFTPIFLSPFFIQNLAFRFDSLTMALSIAMATLPLFFMKKGTMKLFAASAVGILFSLSLYQAALSAFVAIVCLYIIFSIKNEVDSFALLKEVITATVGMVAGYILYARIIIPAFVTSDYANGYNQMIGSASDLLMNIELTKIVIGSFLTGRIADIFLFIFTLSAIGLLSLIINIFKTQKALSQKIINFLLLIVSLFVIALCIPGPGLALKNIPIGPRVFIGFGFAISLCFVLISFINIKHKHKFNIVYWLAAMISFSYMATFSNAMKSQDKLAEKIINGVTDDIIKIGYNKVMTITVDGKSLYTPVADKAIQKLPLLKQIIPSYFDGPLAWGIVKMTEIYSGKLQPNPARQAEIIERICSMQLITDAGLYKTYFNKGDLVISFSFRDCK